MRHLISLQEITHERLLYFVWRVEIGTAAGNKLRELNTAIEGCQCELATYQEKKDKLVGLVQDVESTDSEASLVALGQHLGLVKPTEGCD